MMRHASVIYLLISLSTVGVGYNFDLTIGPNLGGSWNNNDPSLAAARTLDPSMNAKLDLGSGARAHGGGHGHGHGHGGSKAAEAIAAAADAGNVARMLMMKGVLDHFQRQEMEKSLAQMGKKLEDVKAEFKSGKMTAAEYAAVKSAVDQAYTKNSKADIQLDKSVDPASKGNPKLSNQSAANSTDGGNWAMSGRAKAAGTNSDTSLRNGNSDLAKMDLSSNSLGNQKTAKEKTSGGVSSAPANGFPSTGILPVMLTGATAIPTSLSDTKSNQEENDSEIERVLASQGNNSLGSGATDGAHFDGGSTEPMGDSQDFQGNQMIEEEEPSLSDDSRSDSLVTGVASATDYNQLFERLFKPIKFQKNLFSKRLHTKEGYHPGLLLLALAGFFLLGRRIHSNQRIPKVIPELVGGHEPVRKLRIERRQSKRA